MKVFLPHFSQPEWTLSPVKPYAPIITSHIWRRWSLILTQTNPPIKPTYLRLQRDFNSYIPLWSTLHKSEFMTNRTSWCHTHDSNRLDFFFAHLGLGEPIAAASGSTGWSHYTGVKCGECNGMSNGLTGKWCSNDIVWITGLIVKHLHCRRFIVSL